MTVSVALPGSIIANCQTKELKAYIAGSIARTLAVFKVDEVIVYDELCTNDRFPLSSLWDDKRPAKDPNLFLARILQYLETPQYLRSALFPIHPDLKLAGLLNPLDTPHHMRADEEAAYREGVVVQAKKESRTSDLVHVGLRSWCSVDVPQPIGKRVTVKMGAKKRKRDDDRSTGTVVAREAPVQAGQYWGYTVRLANGLSNVFAKGPHHYDLAIGTSERGENILDRGVQIPKHTHMLIVFGGVQGLEVGVEADNAFPKDCNPAELFDMYLNTCPQQGSRTIRTEEAMLISLSTLMSKQALG